MDIKRYVDAMMNGNTVEYFCLIFTRFCPTILPVVEFSVLNLSSVASWMQFFPTQQLRFDHISRIQLLM